MALSDNLRNLRKTEGLSLEKAANLLKVSPAALSNYERGIRDPSVSFLQRISDLYSVPIESLVVKENDDVNQPADVQQMSIPVFSECKPYIPFIQLQTTTEVSFDVSLANISKDDETFFWHLQDDTMSPLFRNGDLVLIQKKNRVSDGEVALIEQLDDNRIILRQVFNGGPGYKLLWQLCPTPSPVRIRSNEISVIGKAILRIG